MTDRNQNNTNNNNTIRVRDSSSSCAMEITHKIHNIICFNIYLSMYECGHEISK